MKLLKHIADKPLPKKFATRSAARAVLLDENGLVPILFVSKYNYHKLPGGGIEEGEDEKRALDREVEEETGCKAEIDGETGKVTEYRSKWNLFQTSFCFLGKIIKKGEPKFTKGEINDGFKLIWISIDDAIKTLKNDRPSDYEGNFIQKRDLVFLEEAKKLLSV